jgi:hypothetical protein
MSAIILCFNSYASEGAYDCSSKQKNLFNKLATRVLDATQYVKKAREMSDNGNKDTLISELSYAQSELDYFQSEYKGSNFCFSFEKQSQYLELKAKKIALEIKVMRDQFKSVDSCDYSISKIEENHNKFREIASANQVSYLEITKSLKKTNLLLSSNECNPTQKKKLFALFDSQSSTLQEVYKGITSVK